MSLAIVQGIPIAVGQAVAQGVAIVEAVVVEAVNEVRDATEMLFSQIDLSRGNYLPGVPIALPGRALNPQIPGRRLDFRYELPGFPNLR